MKIIGIMEKWSCGLTFKYFARAVQCSIVIKDAASDAGSLPGHWLVLWLV